MVPSMTETQHHREAVASEVRAAVARKNIAPSAVAAHLGCAPLTLHRKLRAQSDFSAAELLAVAELLDIHARSLLPADSADTAQGA